jgi:glycosyltransferase involved in cell wall biosynthesis
MGDSPAHNLADQIGLTAHSRGLVIAVCCQAYLRSALEELAARAPGAVLVVVSGPGNQLWEDSARGLAEAARMGRIPVGFRCPPSRALVSAVRSRRADVALVLADEGRTPSRWGQVLGLLSGTRRVWALVGDSPQVSRVSFFPLLAVLARKLRTDVRESAVSIPLLGTAWEARERAIAVSHQRTLPVRSKPKTLAQARVLLVRSGPGASTRYRIDHKLEQLRLLGVQVTARWFREYIGRPVLAARDASQHDLAVIHRLPQTSLVAPLLDTLSRLTRPVVYDIDDLMFAPGLIRFVPRDAQPAVRQQAALLARCTHVMAATDELAQRLREQGHPVWVVANVLSRELLSLSSAARSRCTPHAGVRLGYLSGSPTHDRDLGLVGAALAEILQRHPDTSLVLVGPVAVPKELAGLMDRVTTLPMVAWRDLPPVIASIDVNLAPLETGSPFCQAKSELKYMEAGAVGIPTVATPVAAFRKAISSGANGFLAETQEEWCAALDLLVRRPDRRREVGEAARQDIEARYLPERGAGELAAALSDILGSSGSDSRPGCRDRR